MKYIYLIAGLFNPFFLIGYFFTGTADAIRDARREQKNDEWTITIR